MVSRVSYSGFFFVSGEVHRAMYRGNQAGITARQCGSQSQRRGQVDICKFLAYVNFDRCRGRRDAICAIDLPRDNLIQFNLSQVLMTDPVLTSSASDVGI